MKGNRFFTIIIVPDAQADYKKFSISIAKLKIIIISLIIFFVSFILLFLSNIYFIKSTAQFKKLVPESRKLKDENASYKKVIIDISKKIEDFNLLAKKLKLMAGITQPADAFMENPGVGGLSSADTLTPSLNDGLKEANLLYKSSEQLSKTFLLIEQSFQKQYLLLASTPSITPIRGFISSGYGMRRNPFTHTADFHTGVDISAPLGKPVVSTANGTVIFAGPKPVIGNLVIIDHGYGIKTSYGHLSKILVQIGQKVKRWDTIALVGNTGKSTGPHLHYEISRNNDTVNPLDYMIDFEYLY